VIIVELPSNEEHLGEEEGNKKFWKLSEQGKSFVENQIKEKQEQKTVKIYDGEKGYNVLTLEPIEHTFKNPIIKIDTLFQKQSDSEKERNIKLRTTKTIKGKSLIPRYLTDKNICIYTNVLDWGFLVLKKQKKKITKKMRVNQKYYLEEERTVPQLDSKLYHQIKQVPLNHKLEIHYRENFVFLVGSKTYVGGKTSKGYPSCIEVDLKEAIDIRVKRFENLMKGLKKKKQEPIKEQIKSLKKGKLRSATIKEIRELKRKMEQVGKTLDKRVKDYRNLFDG